MKKKKGSKKGSKYEYVEGKGTYTAYGKSKDKLLNAVDKADRTPQVVMGYPKMRKKVFITPKTPRLR